MLARLFMKKSSYISAFFSLFCTFFTCSYVYGLDVIKISQGQSKKDLRTKYTYEVLQTALELTIPEYGPYEIEIVGSGKPNQRALKLLVSGQVINVALAITRPEWEEKTIPIRIPVRMGLLNYRLLAVHKDNLDKFKGVETVEDLKPLRVGLRLSWATSDIMIAQEYNVVNSYTYDSIFAMLHKGRFDYIPRGLHEVYGELEVRKQDMPNLVVEPNLALYIPAPYYVFVSKSNPLIAERMKAGLELMVEQGVFRQMIDKHYGEYLERADLKSRKIINVGNIFLPESAPLDVEKYWLDLGEAKVSPEVD